jgi:cysteine desulfurase / selenocysteine lyase
VSTSLAAPTGPAAPAPQTTRPFDVEALRAQFPILSRTVHGKPLAYLDSAASAQKPEAVISAMADFQRTSYANVHRGLHTLANEATGVFEAARAAAARLVKAAGPDEIVFTKGATEALNLLANTLAPRLTAGDEIVLTQLEHHANIVPWHMLRERLGVVLRFAPVLPDGSLDMGAMAALIGPRTRIVSVGHMSNVLGTIHDIPAIAALAHEAGALLIVDGCQGVAHLDVDVRALGCDAYVFSGHKIYGPTGIGCLWASAALLDSLPPWQGGGEMIEVVTEETVTWNVPPFRFEAGTPAITEAAGLLAAIEWLEQQDRAAILAHESRLLARATEALSAVNGITLYGTAAHKGSILAFNLEGAHPHDVAQILDRQGVAVRAGHHCAQPLMRALGVTATARASFAAYSTDADVDALVAGLAKARSLLL